MINIGNLKTLATSKDKGKYVLNNLGGALKSVIYRMYISEGKMVYQLPINPETFKTNCGSNNDIYNVLGQGDVVRPRLPKLREWSWDGLFMSDAFDPLNIPGLIFPPMIYVTAIERIQKSKKPVKFMQNTVDLVGSFFGANTKVVVEDFRYEERGGEVGDIYYSIVLKEYKEFGMSVIPLVEGIDTSQVSKKFLDSGYELVDGAELEISGEVAQCMKMENGQMKATEYITKTNLTGKQEGAVFNMGGKPYVKVKAGESTYFVSTNNAHVKGAV